MRAVARREGEKTGIVFDLHWRPGTDAAGWMIALLVPGQRTLWCIGRFSRPTNTVNVF